MTDGIDITPNKDEGVLKKIIQEGTGEEGPQTGDSVTVHYVGTLTDGSQFDSSRDRGEKFQFDLGKGRVIKAWDLGVATMKRGERCILTCRSEYAYGKNGSPPKIPPEATLIFDVELFDWKGEDLSPNNDGSITRSVITAGTGFASPNDGATVDVHLVGKHNNKVFEERHVNFPLGDGPDNQVVEGVEHALKKFKTGETSKLHIHAKYAFGSEGNKDKGIPANAEVDYEVTLKAFEKAKESWEMDSAEKVEQSKLSKDKGTQFFKNGNIPSALRYYDKVVDFLQSEKDQEDETKEERRALLLAAYLNIAACHLKKGAVTKVIENCEMALELEPNNVKGLFRRGMAKMLKQDYTEAIADFQIVVKLDTDNKAARNQIIIANSKIKQQADKDKRTYAGMFDKFTELDAQLGKNRVPESDYGDGLENIGQWDNSMAQGMMTLEQEAEAFGEKLPKPEYSPEDCKPGATAAEGEVEDLDEEDLEGAEAESWMKRRQGEKK